MLIDSIKNGDIKAYKEFFMDYYPILKCFANNILKDAALSKDVAQEALLKFWERKDGFNNIYQAKSFLYVVTKNMCYNLLRDNVSNKQEDFSMEQNYIAEFEADRYIIEQEAILLVRKAINELPDRTRSIIELSMSGLQNSEIAQTLSISQETVHSLKQKAYKKLRVVLDGTYYLIIF